MTLAQALTTARGALEINAGRSAVISRNVAGLNTAGYARKIGETTSGLYGVSTLSIRRETDASLAATMRDAQSGSATQAALAAGWDAIGTAIDGADQSTSPAKTIAALQSALQSLAATPSDTTAARAAIESARDTVQRLNAASADVQTLRKTADGDMASSVARIHALLADVQAANDVIVAGSLTQSDTSDAQDARDRALSDLSKENGHCRRQAAQ